MNQYLADALSRAYLPTTLHLTRAEFENINVATFLPVSTSRLWEIQQATEDDEILQALKAVFLSGWPDDHSQIPEQITPYFSMRDKLSVHDGVIFHRRQIVVPVSLRKDRKQNLHASHLGTESCLRREQETIFWLNMNTKLKEMIETCETCRKYETCHQKVSDTARSTQSTMEASRSGPVWTKQERVPDHSRLLQQFLWGWPPHKYHLISCSFEAEEPFCSLWLP